MTPLAVYRDDHALADMAAFLLTQGGDARILVDPETGLNKYFASPRPTDTIAYASSTANDISAPAFDHLCAYLARQQTGWPLSPEGYRDALAGLRARIRAAYALSDQIDVVFAPSGTDLEYVGLALCKERAEAGIRNILLGADEVGSGCIFSAHGQYFADETARGVKVVKGAPIGGRLPEKIELFNIPVRDDQGHAFRGDVITAQIMAAAEQAHIAGKHVLIHVVHGSKTGLVLPDFTHIDALKARYGDAITFIVDACQARITSAAIGDYLARDCAVLITGSKFMGGPPFNGFALVPRRRVANSAPMPIAFCKIFRHAEWPESWPDSDLLPHEANAGLLLRLEASVFELERFQRISIERISRVIMAFHAAVRRSFVDRLGGRRMAPYAPGEGAEGDAHPIEMRTLSTIDISGLPGTPDFEESQHIHRAMVDHGVRLGQPVKCVRLPDGRWGGTLRVGLSMPQVTAFDALDDAAMTARLDAEMTAIIDVIQRVMHR